MAERSGALARLHLKASAPGCLQDKDPDRRREIGIPPPGIDLRHKSGKGYAA